MDEQRLILADPRPTRADAVKNRELLLETASRLFTENGVETVTMSQIAQAAQVGKGTLYRHFKDKTELCYALLDHEQRDLQNQTLRRLRESADIREHLRWFLEQAVRFVVRNDDLLFGGEASTMMFIQHPAHLWWRQTIRGLLMKIGTRFDVDYAADVLYVMLDVNALRFQRRTLGYDLSRIIAGLHALMDSITTQTD
ncbi:MAG: TetR family transcriptional regulator [bacterium]|nr:TetR family transcriptional regulator [bacterium]